MESLGYQQMCEKHSTIFPPKMYRFRGEERMVDILDIGEFIGVLSSGNNKNSEWLEDDLKLEIGLRFVYIIDKYTR